LRNEEAFWTPRHSILRRRRASSSAFRADRDAEYRELIGRCADFEAEMVREAAAKNFTYAELEENEMDLKKSEATLFD
jgi:hypothetical protein